MAKRVRIPSSIQTKVLVASRRRCCLCFALHGDGGEKRGQIAHLDGNPANASEDNLVFLCLAHHDEYDSRTSQSKGFTVGEVKFYRDVLCAVLQSMSEMTITALGGDDHALLLILLDRAKGWYNEIVNVIGQSVAIKDEDQLERLAYNYGYSRKYVGDLNAINKILSKREDMKEVVSDLRTFVCLLTGAGVDVRGDFCTPCKMPSFREEYDVRAELDYIGSVLQSLTEKVFEFLACRTGASG